jgi:hypothetical protein
MNSIPTNNYTAPDNTYQASLPFMPRQLETQDREARTFINDLFSNNLDFGEFDIDTSVVPRVPPHDTVPRHVNPVVRRRRLNNIRRRVLQESIPRVSSSQTTGFDALPQTNVLAAVAPQLRPTIDPLDGAYIDPSTSLFAGPNSTPFDNGVHVGSDILIPQVQTQSADFNGFLQSHPHAPVTSPPTIDVSDGTSYPITHPSASRPSGSSFAAGIGNILNPMSGLTPALAPSSPLTWMNSMTPTRKPLMRTWETSAASMGPATVAAGASTAFVRAEQRQVPISRCSCCKRANPLVRVDDAIEWVRPDVMKMVLYFNFSLNAEAEAHESWEPRGA